MATQAPVKGEVAFKEFLFTASPKKKAKFIEALEQLDDHDFGELITKFKQVTFLDMLNVLNVKTHVLSMVGKDFQTHLHIGEITGDRSMIYSQQDYNNQDEVNTNLYDLHKDKLLRLIDKLADAKQ